MMRRDYLMVLVIGTCFLLGCGRKPSAPLPVDPPKAEPSKKEDPDQPPIPSTPQLADPAANASQAAQSHTPTTAPTPIIVGSGEAGVIGDRIRGIPDPFIYEDVPGELTLVVTSRFGKTQTIQVKKQANPFPKWVSDVNVYTAKASSRTLGTVMLELDNWTRILIPWDRIERIEPAQADRSKVSLHGGTSYEGRLFSNVVDAAGEMRPLISSDRVVVATATNVGTINKPSTGPVTHYIVRLHDLPIKEQSFEGRKPRFVQPAKDKSTTAKIGDDTATISQGTNFVDAKLDGAKRLSLKWTWVSQADVAVELITAEGELKGLLLPPNGNRSLCGWKLIFETADQCVVLLDF